MFTMDDLLEIAIQMEENGKTVYNSAAGKIKQETLKPMLEWMANEEASHGKWFLDQKNAIALESEEADLKQMVPAAFQEMMGEKTLSLEDINFNKIKTVSSLLETFIGFEKDTILFYELLEMFIQEDPVKEGLKKIIQEEKTHIETLTSMMASLPENNI